MFSTLNPLSALYQQIAWEVQYSHLQIHRMTNSGSCCKLNLVNKQKIHSKIQWNETKCIWKTKIEVMLSVSVNKSAGSTLLLWFYFYIWAWLLLFTIRNIFANILTDTQLQIFCVYCSFILITFEWKRAIKNNDLVTKEFGEKMWPYNILINAFAFRMKLIFLSKLEIKWTGARDRLQRGLSCWANGWGEYYDQGICNINSNRFRIPEKSPVSSSSSWFVFLIGWRIYR